MKPLTRNFRRDREAVDLGAYEAAGGYRGLRMALRTSPADVRGTVRDARLRGRGGAGFPTGVKWSAVPDVPGQKYLVVNADEMEPGTFKDRWLLELDPHQLLEGTAIAAWAIGASIAYVFLRHEYRLAFARLRRAIEEMRAAGFAGTNVLGSGFDLEVRIHVSAGRYMCGEETGLLNALEGKRATPRAKPPYPQQVGLWGRPTVVQNVETLCNVAHIGAHGPGWYHELSRSTASSDTGTKLYGASGKVNRPGLWELPIGTSAQEILFEHAGGMHDGRTLRGVLPGGASTDFIAADQLDVKMDFESLPGAGSRLGTGTMIVLDDATCPVAMVLNLERFFARESCGWCTPCREGLPWTVRTLEALEAGAGTSDDIDLLAMHAHFLGPGKTFCALAPGAAEPLGSALRHFGDDFERHVRLGRCPWRS